MVTLMEALRQHIPALCFAEPHGGYFIWSCLPEGTDTEILLSQAHKHLVGFQTGVKFSSSLMASAPLRAKRGSRPFWAYNCLEN